MKNSFLHKILSLSLSLLVFITSTGFTLNIHFCDDEFSDISILNSVEKKDCPKIATNCLENNSHKSKITEPNCCKNKTVFLDKTENNVISDNISVSKDINPVFFVAFVSGFTTLVDLEKLALLIPDNHLGNGGRETKLHILYHSIIV